MTTTTRWDRETGALTHFENDTTDHQMTVLHDDGLYRHLRFKKSGTGMYWFDIVTWPGALTINGDMGTYTFSRDSDMFEFFRAGSRYGINPDYWAEKIRCGQSASRDHVKEYSEDAFREHVAHHLDAVFDGYLDDLADNDGRELWPGLADELTDRLVENDDTYYEDGARQALADFEYTVTGHGGVQTGRSGRRIFTFDDTWEWDLRDYAYPYLWCCHAILWGIRQYDASRVGAVA
jgi:hypothetical protein